MYLTDQRHPFARIDITPLVGVLAALLVLPLLMAPMTELHRPRPVGCGPMCSLGVPPAVTLIANDDGTYFWDATLIDGVQLRQRLDRVAEKSQRIDVRMPAHSTYAQLSALLDAFAKRDIRNFGFLASGDR